MKINKKLNLVVPIETEGGLAYVHSVPISLECFEANHLVIARTFASIYDQRLSVSAGPRIAALLLRDHAKRLGIWDGPDGTQASLMAEIHRLTNVIAPGANGWESYPWQEALDSKRFEPEAISEVENAIVFFTVASAMHHNPQRDIVVRGAAGLWNGRIVSSNCTDFAISLTTSTEAESAGATVKH